MGKYAHILRAKQQLWDEWFKAEQVLVPSIQQAKNKLLIFDLEKSNMKKFTDAFNGIIAGVKEGSSIKIQLIAMVLAIAFGAYFNISTTEWCFVIIAITLVIAAEIFNTAIEQICNFMEPHHNKKIGTIKDLSAGAVLVLAVMSFVVGAIIFVPKILGLW